MTTLTIASMKASFWSLLKSDTAGATARASLGAGAASVLTRKQFQQTAPTALPARPLAVVEYGESPGEKDFVRNILPTIWLYDDALQDWNRLNTLEALIEALYDRDAIAYCYTKYAGGIGAERLDPALGLPVLALRYQVIGRF